jgi:DNA-binding IclR family transcriptional regulator
LDPALVAFLPDHSSTSWPKIRQAGRFCVNILAAGQEPVCRAFASKAPDKFAGLRWRPGNSGAPVLDGVVAWIECELEAVYPAGDHDIAIGRVSDLQLGEPTLPLVFFEGGYGRFEPMSRASADADLFDVLRFVDPGRAEMERLAQDLGVECVAGALVGDEIVHVASAGTPAEGDAGLQVGIRVGRRSPLAPPLGMSWLPWSDERVVADWFARSDATFSEDETEAWRHALRRVQEHGFWIRLGGASETQFDNDMAALSAALDPRQRRSAFHELFDGHLTEEYAQPELLADSEYEVRSMSAPVFDEDGRQRYALILFGLPPSLTGADIARTGRRLIAGCELAGRAIPTNR